MKTQTGKAYIGWRLPVSAEANAKAKARAERNAKLADRETADLFAHRDERFKAACKLAGIPATARQASKWRRKTGLAFQTAEKVGGPDAVAAALALRAA